MKAVTESQKERQRVASRAYYHRGRPAREAAKEAKRQVRANRLCACGKRARKSRTQCQTCRNRQTRARNSKHYQNYRQDYRNRNLEKFEAVKRAGKEATATRRAARKAIAEQERIVARQESVKRRELIEQERLTKGSHNTIKKKLRVWLWKRLKLKFAFAEKYQPTIGCSTLFLHAWFESKFKRGMSWANYGQAWEADHIIPCHAFNLTAELERRTCFHYTNLRPLTKTQNRRKSATVSPTQPELAMGIPAKSKDSFYN